VAPTVRLHALGAVDLRGTAGDELRSVLVQPKRLALLAYLAIATPQRLHRRDALFALFWPDVDIEQARRSLRQSLYLLRQWLGAGVVVTRGDDEIGIDPHAFWCDVRAFERALDDDRADEALTLYRGELLQGFHVTGVAPEFDHWLEDERARLRSRAVGAATALRDGAERDGNLSLAIRYARDVLRLDPASEVALRSVMLLLDRTGERAVALRTYDEFSSRIASAFDLQPSAETAALAEELRGERVRVAVDRRLSVPAVAPSSGIAAPNDEQRARPSRWRRWSMPTVAVIGLFGLGQVLYRQIVATTDASAVVPIDRQFTFKGNVGLSSISPDGRSIAYITGNAFDAPDEDTLRLFVSDVEGGRALEIAQFSAARSLHWTPDGAHLLVDGASQGTFGIYLVPRLGGPLQRQPWLPGSALSHDGTRLATWFGPNRLIIRDTPSGDTLSLQVPGGNGLARDAAWSPGGNRLAVLSFSATGNSSLWSLAPNGTDSALVVPSSEGKIESWTWSAAGDAFYYVIKDQLWRVPLTADGHPSGPPRLLLANMPVNTFRLVNDISVSSGGDRLAYTRIQGHANLWISAAAATGPEPVQLRQVTTGTELKECVVPSPDLERVAYLERNADGGKDIFVAQVSNGKTQRVTYTGTASSCPAWSPSGDSLALLTDVQTQRRITVVRTNDATASSLAQGVGQQIAWSPDGRIVYHEPGNRNFVFFDPKTGAEHGLVANDSVGFMFNPVIAPDGKRVVVRWNRAGASGFWLVSLADGSQQPLRGTSADDFAFSWTRDGRAVLVVGPDRVVRRVAVSTGKSTIAAKSPDDGCQPFERANGRGLTFICMVSEVTSDVWVVQNFDPLARARH
jgi:DNA-binding SARP family transcriptional activator/Tol biopolymer transport system component